MALYGLQNMASTDASNAVLTALAQKIPGIYFQQSDLFEAMVSLQNQQSNPIAQSILRDINEPLSIGKVAQKDLNNLNILVRHFHTDDVDLHCHSFLFAKTLAKLLTQNLTIQNSVTFICGKSSHRLKNRDKMQNAVIEAVQENRHLTYTLDSGSGRVTVIYPDHS